MLLIVQRELFLVKNCIQQDRVFIDFLRMSLSNCIESMKAEIFSLLSAVCDLINFILFSCHPKQFLCELIPSLVIKLFSFFFFAVFFK